MSVRCESSNGSMSFCAYVKYIPPRCPSVRKREWFRQVYRFPDSTECRKLLSTEAFGARVSACRPFYGACARVHIYCAYICCVCFQIYMCADPRRLEFLAEVSCAYLVRHAQSAGGKYNFAELLAAEKTGAFRTEEYTLCKFKFTTYACAKHITLPTVECKNLTVECNLKA